MKDEMSQTQVEEEMTVEVRPGDDEQTSLVFATKGNEAYSMHQAPLKVRFRL